MIEQLPTPPLGRPDAVEWVDEHLGHLTCDDAVASPSFRGGRTAALAALDDLDISGYAAGRNHVHPPDRRGASRMSPWIRHGLLHLAEVWDRMEDAPSRDRWKYRSELLWQEFSRHWYAVTGTATQRPVAFEPVEASEPWPHDPWWADMNCMAETMAELHTDGWVVNQTRMWLASQYTVRGHGPWREGEDHMFRHLLDGSRAANRLGWQWTVGASRSRSYGFARRQVLKRAPAYCENCRLVDDCPIRGYAKTDPRSKVPRPDILDLEDAYGPTSPTSADRGPEVVWLTAESLGDTDPALTAHSDLPVWFVFDQPLLETLRLSTKRLVFLAESLADLSTRRDVTVFLGRPASALSQSPAAVTFAPVPGFRRISAQVSNLTVHPWPWLRPPTDTLAQKLHDRGYLTSFSDWNRLTEPAVDEQEEQSP